ncbi:MAG: proteinase inhibitor I4 serpin [Planctomycetes bacterium]|nr:proteinase inhibitor I4 serpin [Planctomycetota bacterium]
MGQQSVDNLKAYPVAENGMTRHVIHLNEMDHEDDYRVELLIGKTVELDETNRYFFGGSVEEVIVEGWGFPKYVVKELGPMAGTLIGVDPTAPKVKRFVRLGGESKLLRYNSKLPLVVYVPSGTEVRYRMWKAEKESAEVPKG